MITAALLEELKQEPLLHDEREVVNEVADALDSGVEIRDTQRRDIERIAADYGLL